MLSSVTINCHKFRFSIVRIVISVSNVTSLQNCPQLSKVVKIANIVTKINKLASLEATLVRNYDPLNHLLTGVKCRATSVAKNTKTKSFRARWSGWWW